MAKIDKVKYGAGKKPKTHLSYGEYEGKYKIGPDKTPNSEPVGDWESNGPKWIRRGTNEQRLHDERVKRNAGPFGNARDMQINGAIHVLTSPEYSKAHKEHSKQEIRSLMINKQFGGK